MKEVLPAELSKILKALDDAKAIRPLRAISRPVREQWTMEKEYPPFDAPVAVEPRVEPEADRLTQLASLLRTITWGKMTELGEGIGRTGGGGPITQADLPMMLHRWATRGMA